MSTWAGRLSVRLWVGGVQGVQGTPIGTVISGGGLEEVFSGAMTIDTTILSDPLGGLEFVQAGGTALSTTVNFGAHELAPEPQYPRSSTAATRSCLAWPTSRPSTAASRWCGPGASTSS